MRSWRVRSQTGRSTVIQTLEVRTGWGLRTEDKFPQHFVPRAGRKRALVVLHVWGGGKREGNVRVKIARTQITMMLPSKVRQ